MELLVKGRCVTDKFKVCNNFFSRAKGLMFSFLRGFDGAVLVFDRDSFVSVHMLFVFLPLDIFWVDSDFRIVDVRRSVKPFTPLLIPKSMAKYVVETRCGLVRDVRIGEKMIVK